MAKMRAIQVTKPGAPFELVERERPKPGFGEVLVKVQACGVCHSDSIAKDGLSPGIPYPIIPGHEVAGVIEEAGEGVGPWTVGTRVGVGWFGGHCGFCVPCRRGDLICCQNIRIPGLSHDGGYAEYMRTQANGLVRIPDDLASEDAAPLLCAGVTTYNSLRQSGARPGDTVAVLGIGGLGHLGVQFARKMGFRTVAIARGADKEPLAKELGAHIYIDAETSNAAEELKKLGGAKTILATAPNSQAMTELIPGLSVRGVLVIIGVGGEPIQVSAIDMIPTNRRIQGHASGAAIDSEDTLKFSVLANVRPKIEVMPLERVTEAYDKMMAAQARFRMVLTTGLYPPLSRRYTRVRDASPSRAPQCPSVPSHRRWPGRPSLAALPVNEPCKAAEFPIVAACVRRREIGFGLRNLVVRQVSHATPEPDEIMNPVHFAAAAAMMFCLSAAPFTAQGHSAQGQSAQDGAAQGNTPHAAPAPAWPYVRYFAEGSTGFFETTLGLFNPSPVETAQVMLTLLVESGGTMTHELTLGPHQRQTLSINEILGFSAAVSIVVRSDVPLAADRWMTWGSTGIGASLDNGAPAPGTTWYFAEGATGPFLLYYLLQNPGTEPANVTVRYLVEGGAPVTTQHVLGPQSRSTVFVNGDDPALAATSLGAVITSDVPIFAERAMYVNAGGTLGGGSVSAASSQAVTDWYFGEGSTGPFFHTFLSMLNPGTTPASVTVTYHMSDGSTASKVYEAPAEGRKTIYFNAEAAEDPSLALLATGPVWFTVSSTEPIVAERAMWWAADWPWYEGHAAAGSTTNGAAWAVPEGRHGGPAFDRTYVLIGNTTTAPSDVRLTLIPDAGVDAGAGAGVAVTRDLPIGAGERLTLDIGTLFELTDARFSVIVQSLSSPLTPLAVDYARYRSANGILFSGGGATPAIPLNTAVLRGQNLPPSFTGGPDVTVLEDSGPRTMENWATAMSPGADDEADQMVAFVVTANTNPALFSVAPAVSPTGTLTFTPAPDAHGTATIAIALQDDAGTAHGGNDTSATHNLTITVDPINDAPSFTAANPPVVLEDAGPQSVPNWATFSAGPADESAQTPTYSVTNVAIPALFSVLPSIASDGTLTYTPADNAGGQTTFTVVVQDNGGTANGGIDSSAPVTFTLEIDPENDPPTVTVGGVLSFPEDGPPTAIEPGLTLADPDGDHIIAASVWITGNYVNGEDVLSFANTPGITGTFSAATGQLMLSGGDTSANYQAALRTVRYQNLSGTPNTSPRTVTWTTTDGNGSTPVITVINVLPVNDAPTFTIGPDATSWEDTGMRYVTHWASGMSAGPADESSQTFEFLVTNNTNPGLFTVAPAAEPSGKLSYTLAPGVNGTAQITMVVKDDGGTANGGADTSAPQTFTITVLEDMQYTTSMVLTSSPANLDTPETYRLRISVPNDHHLLPISVQDVSDVLPPGTVFNGATPAADCQPGCVGTTPVTVTWTNPCPSVGPGGNCNITVNVTFPSATFPSGTTVRNTFGGSVTASGEQLTDLGQTSIDHTVTTFVANPLGQIVNGLAEDTAEPPTLNQTFGYQLTVRNPGNVPLDNLVVIDTVPVEFQVLSVTTGTYPGAADFGLGEGVRVSYEKNTALGVFTLWGSSPNVTSNTTLTAPPPGLGAGEYITRVRWEYGQAQPGMEPGMPIRLTGRIINPDNAGGPVAFGDTIQNCADLSAVYTAGPTNVNFSGVCQTFTLSGPFVQLNPATEVTTLGEPFDVGGPVTWRLRVRSAAQSSDPLPLEHITITDVVPDGLTFSSWTFDDQGTGLPAPQNFEAFPNFDGAGRTLLRWRWNAGSGSLGAGQQVWINASTTVTGNVFGSPGTGIAPMLNALAINHAAPGLALRCSGTSAADPADLDGDGNTAETFCTATRSAETFNP